MQPCRVSTPFPKTFLVDVRNCFLQCCGSATSMDEISSIRETTIPRLQRMRHRTYYIRNTQPELSRGIKIIADCLIDLYSTPCLLHEFHVLTIMVIASRFYMILQFKKGADRAPGSPPSDRRGREGRGAGRDGGGEGGGGRDGNGVLLSTRLRTKLQQAPRWLLL